MVVALFFAFLACLFGMILGLSVWVNRVAGRRDQIVFAFLDRVFGMFWGLSVLVGRVTFRLGQSLFAGGGASLGRTSAAPGGCAVETGWAGKDALFPLAFHA